MSPLSPVAVAPGSSNLPTYQADWLADYLFVQNVLLYYPSSGKSSSVMEDVCKKTGVRDQQLDQEIADSDIILLSSPAEHKLGSTYKLYMQLVVLTFWRGEQMVYMCVWGIDDM